MPTGNDVMRNAGGAECGAASCLGFGGSMFTSPSGSSTFLLRRTAKAATFRCRCARPTPSRPYLFLYPDVCVTFNDRNGPLRMLRGKLPEGGAIFRVLLDKN